MPTGYSFSMICLKFLNENTGFIAGTSNTILRTTNGGNNWERVNYINGFLNFSSICFVNSNIGYVAGSNGNIYKTTNNGINWFQLSSPSTKLYSILFAINHGYIVGTGNILKTTDGAPGN
jgi:photosystem II stability/assembly factor-like uncharacterized protein